MAGVGLVDLKRRIKSVIGTQKITKAMGLVATVKFKTARVGLERHKPYYEKYCQLINRILSMPDISEKICLTENETGKDMYIVITSDSGLCGGYNSNILNTVVNEIGDRKDEVVLVTVGQKGKNFFEARGYEIAASFSGANVNSSYEETSGIVRAGMDYFESGKAKNVYVVHTKFISPLKQTVEIAKLLPLEKSDAVNEDYILYEPSLESIYSNIIPKYLNTAMYNMVSSSITSEFAMRMNSMDNATKNASDVIDNLKTIYNRARQANITKEINEIVSGAEALKE